MISLTKEQIVEQAVFTLLATVLVVLAALSVVAGSSGIGLTVAGYRFVLWELVTAVFLGLVAVGGGVVLLRQLLENPTRLTGEGPSVDAILPVYQDHEALERGVTSLAATPYEGLSIHVVCEPDDERSIAEAERLAAEYDAVDCMVNETRPGTKAGAINHAVEATDGDVLAFFDADLCVDELFLLHALPYLEDHGAVQGRTVVEPRDWLSSLSYYEDFLFEIGMALVSTVMRFDWIASTSTVIRREVYERVGGYSEDTVSEDLDFAHRCAQEGVSVRKLFGFPSFAEGAHTLADFWALRKRWMIGSSQVSGNLLSELRGGVELEDLLSAVSNVGMLLGSIAILFIVAQGLFAAAFGRSMLMPVALAVVAVMALVMRLLDRWQGYVEEIGLMWLVAPLLLPVFSLVTIKALAEYLVSWEGEWFRAEKRG